MDLYDVAQPTQSRSQKSAWKGMVVRGKGNAVPAASTLIRDVVGCKLSSGGYHLLVGAIGEPAEGLQRF